MATKRSRKTRAAGVPAVAASPAQSGRLLMLTATAFLANMFIMCLELVAGQLVARFIGSSLYTWTTIIGAVLLGMSIGAYLGGRLSDRYTPRKLLAVLLLLAGAACPLVLLLNQMAGHFPLLRGMSWPPRIFFHITFTFLVPCVFIGSITPVILRDALRLSAGTGRIIGIIYAASAFGSVIGTFTAGFILIPNLGIRMIVLLLGTGLGALATYYAWISRNENFALPSPTQGEEKTSVSVPAGTVGALAAVFIANAAFMVYELAASRLATQYLGHSIYTWTSLLGIVLAGIMLGNYIGGRLSDRIAPDRLVPWFFSIAATLVLLSLPLYRWLAEDGLLDVLDWDQRIFTQILLAFFIPSVALGTIGPAAARKAIALSSRPGNTLGIVYATGSLASVSGTFLTGYFLVDHLWPIGTVLLLSVILAGASVVWSRGSRLAGFSLPLVVVALIIAALPAEDGTGIARTLGLREQNGPEFVYRDHSQYSWIAVTASKTKPSYRNLYLDQLLHSTADINTPLELEYEYEQIYRGVVDACFPPPQAIRANVLGGGGFVYPRFLDLTRPGSYVETVEIDPAVTKAAREAFGLPRTTRIAVYEMDARNRIEDLVRENERVYDCIFGDSFNQYSVPAQLTTLEFNRHLYTLLSENGIYFMNLIESMQHGAFLGSAVRTMREVFPNVYAIRSDTADSTRDTFVVIGAKKPIDLLPVIESMREQFNFPGDVVTEAEIDEIIRRNASPVLTDDFAPVDNMVGPLMNTRQSSVSVQTRRRAVELIEEGRLDDALPLLESLHQMEPNDTEVVRDLALIYGRRGELHKAEPYFVKATELEPRNAELHYNLGLLYSQTGRDGRAVDSFATALILNPDYSAAAFALGSALNAVGNAEDAIEPLTRATELEPENASGYVLLANTLASLKRFDEAQPHFERAIELEPDMMVARENLARLHLNRREYAQAREQYVKLLEKDPRNPLILYLFGVTLEAEDRPGEAAHYYRLALDINPGLEDARIALERAESASAALGVTP